ncbi:acid protease, partial [Atractiella rhizophila]
MVTVSLLLCVTGASATFLPPSSSRREEWQKRGLNVVSITKHIKSSESNERRRLRFSKRADGGEEFSNGAPLDGLSLLPFRSLSVAHVKHAGIYLGQIELGTPGQNFTLQFATGSADLWVYGPDANTTKHPKFATSASSTFVGSATPWEITYSDGTTTTGFVAQDTLGIAGFTIPSQGFSVANITSEQLDSEVEDGLIGLGFSTLASNKQTTFMEHLIAGHGGTLNSPVFSLFLERDITFQNFNSSSATDSTGGEICVGCMDESRYKGNVTFVDVASDIFWAVDCQGLTANGKTISGTNMRILVDSGSSIVNLPANIIQAYAEGIGASIQNQGGGNYVLVMSCGALATLGFGFNIGGNIYDVAPLDLFVGTTQGGQCAAQAVDSNNIPLGVVGDAFMKNWYTVFS